LGQCSCKTWLVQDLACARPGLCKTGLARPVPTRDNLTRFLHRVAAHRGFTVPNERPTVAAPRCFGGASFVVEWLVRWI
jgi:hypothetical protein